MLDGAARGVNETSGLLGELGGKCLRERKTRKQKAESRKQKAESRKKPEAEFLK
jgi:hypothetical protein